MLLLCLQINGLFVCPSVWFSLPLSLSLSRTHSLTHSLTHFRIRTPQAKTLRGFTPLHFAYQQHTEEIIKHLIAGKADVTAKSALGQAPGSKGAGLGSELEILKPFYGETTKGKKSSIPP